MPQLISDLALILLVAATVTLLFKWLKQPVVLGYIAAGFLCSPHFALIPSVHDIDNIDIWGQVGVIILLFTLGLEFSFKKVLHMGAAPAIAAFTIICTMIFLGSAIGHLFGWTSMDCIYLGGMLAMSSTTIIYKAFQDLGVLKQKFAGIVLSVLILEDILAIVLMVMLSTLAVSRHIEGTQLIFALLRLAFFLALWFIVGLWLIPLMLKKNQRYLNGEMLLIVSLALCFFMAVVAVKAGFSAAFGAFVVGSILAETIEAQRIEKLVAPVKDLFGAIFFVSVGMLVDPHILTQYALPIIVITLTIIIGQAIFGTIGYLLAGQPLKDAIKCGFSMTQIGEFAFIIASSGIALGVTSKHLYPIVVAVSVITTFTTPYMLRAATPAYNTLCKILPTTWTQTLERYTPGTLITGHNRNWNKLIQAMIKQITIFTILTIILITLTTQFLQPLLQKILPPDWAQGTSGIITLLCATPFLRGMMARGHRSRLFKTMWRENRYNRLPLIFTLIVRIIVICAIIFYIIHTSIPFADPFLVILILTFLAFVTLSRPLRFRTQRMHKALVGRIREKTQQHTQTNQQNTPQYAQQLLTKDLHLADFKVPDESHWGGCQLSQLKLSQRYNIHIASIIRGTRHINIPGGTDRIFPHDIINVVGTDRQIEQFAQALNNTANIQTQQTNTQMTMKTIVINKDSPFTGKKIQNCNIRETYHCMIVGIETTQGIVEKPTANRTLNTNEILWIVGEQPNIDKLTQANTN